MMRIAVKIAYQGKGFCGSQIQPGVRTVEESVLTDLSKIMDRPRRWFGLKMAGRTDRGVNALGNVAVFNSIIDDPKRLIDALNNVSKDVFYRGFASVDESFEPRHATSRTYRYILPSDGHDIVRVKECASMFVGEHDFKKFCKNDERSTVITITSADVSVSGDLITIDIKASHFLWNMIRRMAAAISAVGTGRSSAEDVRRALDGQDVSFGLARPDALFFIGADYDGIEFISAKIPGKRTDDDMFRIAMETEFFRFLKN